MSKKTHIRLLTETASLCNRQVDDCAVLGPEMLVAITPDKCLQCLKAGTFISLRYVDAERTRLLTSAEVSSYLNL